MSCYTRELAILFLFCSMFLPLSTIGVRSGVPSAKMHFAILKPSPIERTLRNQQLVQVSGIIYILRVLWCEYLAENFVPKILISFQQLHLEALEEY